MRVADTQTAQSDLIEKLRRRPNDLDSRLQLFRFCVINGKWERARTQLDVVDGMDASLSHTAMVYRRNIACEEMRTRVFAGAEAPVFLGEPPAWLGYLVQALQEGDSDDATALVHAALEAAEPVSGAVNGVPFAWLADADSRLGPTLEAFVDGKYYWIPFEHISQVTVGAPEDLLDLAWCPAEITLVNGGICNGYIPTRYPATDSSDSEDLKLARLTEWIRWSGAGQKGIGQRMFVSDQDEYALLDCREIRFDPKPPARLSS